VIGWMWVGLSLNPHPFKKQRVRHPTAGEGFALCGRGAAALVDDCG
jgi:hypothetical protein